MFHKGLNKEIIVNTAKELIEQEGVQNFSMRKLADKLEVKTAKSFKTGEISIGIDYQLRKIYRKYC